MQRSDLAVFLAVFPRGDSQGFLGNLLKGQRAYFRADDRHLAAVWSQLVDHQQLSEIDLIILLSLIASLGLFTGINRLLVKVLVRDFELFGICRISYCHAEQIILF
jgi:hypothetical protein